MDFKEFRMVLEDETPRIGSRWKSGSLESIQESPMHPNSPGSIPIPTRNSRTSNAMDVDEIVPERPSRNAIFSTSQNVSKPAEQMSEAELCQLRGLPPPTYPESRQSGPKSPILRRSWVNIDNELTVNTTQAPLAEAYTNILMKSHSANIISPHSAHHSFSIHKTPHIKLSFVPIAANFLGEGRYGEVYRGLYSVDPSMSDLSEAALDDMPMKECAVKRMALTPECQVMSFAEVFILKRLTHPNIISLLGVKDEETGSGQQASNTISLFDTSARLLLVLELAAMGNVWDFIMSHKAEVGESLWLRWATQSASALAFIHEQGIVHHDIKPHNMLLTNTLDVRLADFGNCSYVPNKSPTLSEFNQENHQVSKHYISTLPALPSFPFQTGSPQLSMTPIPSIPKSEESSEVLHDGIGRGTQAYTAPEIYSRDGGHSFPSDIYSLGVCFYVIQTARNPFESIKNGVQMINAIQRGFFECGMQVDPDANGPIVGVMKFLDGNLVPKRYVDMIRSMVYKKAVDRPTAQSVLRILSE